MKLTTGQVAFMLRVNPKTVWAWANSGALPSTRDERGWRWFEEAHLYEFCRREDRTVAFPIPQPETPSEERKSVRRGIDLIDTEEL